PQELPLPMAEEGSYSADGTHLAYVPEFQWEPFWKDYKGGQHTQVWLARLSDSSVVRIPDQNANESDPMWVGDTVYFLSDRDGPITLFAYDTGTGQVRRVIDNTGFDITSASAGPGGIVYSQFGQLHVYDYASGHSRAVPVTVTGDLPQLRPRFINVAKLIDDAAISPSGVRALFEANGDILSVPTRHGSFVNLTHSPGVMDRDPAWSPDGRWVAYFSDRAGEYDLYIRAQNGTGTPRRIVLGQKDAFYYGLTWSPDSRKLVFGDQKLNLWYVDLAAPDPRPVKVASNDYATLQHFHPAWSPDSRWIVYTRVMPNYLHAIFIYSLANGSTHQVTDASSDCRDPVFDANGKYLYFTSSTDTALTSGLWEMSGMERPVTRHVYAATLEPATVSPLAPRAGFESAKSSFGKTRGKRPAAVRVAIDFDGLQQRAVALPIPAANYVGLAAGSSGVLYLQKEPLVILQSDPGPYGVPVAVARFDLAKRKMQPVVAGVTDFQLAADGKHMLYRRGKQWFIAAAKPKASRENKLIKFSFAAAG
ncbi:peptidase S41, partial [mine drainage metagenome]